MPVDFIRKPAGGGLSIVNVGAHPIPDILPAILRFASLLGADEILTHKVHETLDDMPIKGIKMSYDLTSSPDTALLKKDGQAVGAIVGIPISKGLLDRARAMEDAAKT